MSKETNQIQRCTGAIRTVRDASSLPIACFVNAATPVCQYLLVTDSRGRLKNQRSSYNWLCLPIRDFGIPTQRRGTRMGSQSLSGSTDSTLPAIGDPPVTGDPTVRDVWRSVTREETTWTSTGSRNVPDCYVCHSSQASWLDTVTR